MFTPFVYLLRDLGIPVSFQYVMEFCQALQKGLVTDLARLFLVSRLIFVKRVEHYDLFERAFAAYFLGQSEALDIPAQDTVLGSKPFQEWLLRELSMENLTADVVHDMPLEELLQRFWSTVLAQKEEHHGGNRWVGTGGRSPWGHSGFSRGGVRVYGASMHQSAMKVYGQRRYIDYAAESNLSAENIRQALSMLKRMVPVGPSTELNIDETIYRTCKNGGEIELIFDRELKDKIEVMLLLDNGGFSMDPYIGIVKLLFTKMRDHFRDVKFYYFHNCIYDGVYLDIYRNQFCPLKEIFQKDRNTRLFIVGDANMAPSEIFATYGAIDFTVNNRLPGIESLKSIAGAFPYSVWLNPIPKNYWQYQSITLQTIGEIFHMEDLTLNGLKNAVEYLREKKAALVSRV